MTFTELIHYRDRERQDADQVERAYEALRDRAVDWARETLDPVLMRVPDYYVYSFETPHELYVKFWDLQEYLGYIALVRKPGETPTQEVIWLRSAYPRGLHLMVKIHLLEGDLASAAERLDTALRLEPDHPDLHVDMATVYARSEEYDKALAHYELALRVRPYLSRPTKQRAQKGVADMLAHLGEVDEATRANLSLLMQAPGRLLEENLRAYTEAVRAGEVMAPLALEVPYVDRDVIDDDEVVELPPPAASAADEAAPVPRPRRWWQIWRRR